MANSSIGGWPTHPQPQTHPHRHNSSPCLRAFAAGMVLLLSIALIIYTVQYFIFRPILPILRVDTLQLANFSAAAPSLISSWVVGFSVNNPNKKLAISFQNLESSIYYKDNIIAQARIHRFLLRRRNSTAVVTPFITDSPVDESVLNDIKGDLACGAINFNVVVLGYAEFQIGVWRWRGTNFRVLCSDLSVGLLSPLSPGSGSGQLVGGSRQCQLR